MSFLLKSSPFLQDGRIRSFFSVAVFPWRSCGVIDLPRMRGNPQINWGTSLEILGEKEDSTNKIIAEGP